MAVDQIYIPMQSTSLLVELHGGGGGGGRLSTCVNREQTFLGIPPKGGFQLPEAVLNSASKLKEVCGAPV